MDVVSRLESDSLTAKSDTLPHTGPYPTDFVENNRLHIRCAPVRGTRQNRGGCYSTGLRMYASTNTYIHSLLRSVNANNATGYMVLNSEFFERDGIRVRFQRLRLFWGEGLQLFCVKKEGGVWPPYASCLPGDRRGPANRQTAG